MVQGMEVRPRRAREAFWRWEQASARWTRDMLGFGGWVGARERGEDLGGLGGLKLGAVGGERRMRGTG